MKITFEGEMLRDIIDQMEDVLSAFAARQRSVATKPAKPAPVTDAAVVAAAEQELRAPWPKPVEKPVEKPKRARTEKQLANDEKLRVLAQERKAAGTMFKKTKAPAPVKQVAAPPPQPEPKIEPEPQPEPFADPAEIVGLRARTIAELQEAYANGHQKEVFELLSRFGDGAKSFRELPPEAFMPIREAIDKGALT